MLTQTTLKRLKIEKSNKKFVRKVFLKRSFDRFKVIFIDLFGKIRFNRGRKNCYLLFNK